MHAAPEIQFQISLLNIASQGEAQEQSQELTKLLDEQLTTEKR
jgi:hypothetical protein